MTHILRKFNSLWDFVNEHQVNTVKFNWLHGISECYHQGMYSVDYEEILRIDFLMQ